jgi:hypothetical protein
MRIAIIAGAFLAGTLAVRFAFAADDVVSSAVSSASIRRSPQFPCIRVLLQAIVDAEDVRGPQRLYLGPRERAGGGAFVRVYWPQAHALLQIDWPASCAYADLHIDAAVLGWYRTKARIDLDTEVVPTPDDIGSSTYLADRVWVNRVIAACKRGHLLVIEPRARGGHVERTGPPTPP